MTTTTETATLVDQSSPLPTVFVPDMKKEIEDPASPWSLCTHTAKQCPEENLIKGKHGFVFCGRRGNGKNPSDHDTLLYTPVTTNKKNNLRPCDVSLRTKQKPGQTTSYTHATQVYQIRADQLLLYMNGAFADVPSPTAVPKPTVLGAELAPTTKAQRKEQKRQMEEASDAKKNHTMQLERARKSASRYHRHDDNYLLSAGERQKRDAKVQKHFSEFLVPNDAHHSVCEEEPHADDDVLNTDEWCKRIMIEEQDGRDMKFM